MLLAVLVLGCAEDPAGRVGVKAEGRDVVLEGNRALRGVALEIEWEGLTVNEITAGVDAERMNLFRAQIDGARARVLLTDTRKIKLPVRGSLVHLDAEGEGELRVLSATGADDEGRLVEIEVDR